MDESFETKVTNVDMHRTGIFATEAERQSIRDAFGSEGTALDVAELMNKAASRAGLPVTKSGYGILLPEGEFVCLRSEFN